MFFGAHFSILWSWQSTMIKSPGFLCGLSLIVVFRSSSLFFYYLLGNFTMYWTEPPHLANGLWWIKYCSYSRSNFWLFLLFPLISLVQNCYLFRLICSIFPSLELSFYSDFYLSHSLQLISSFPYYLWRPSVFSLHLGCYKTQLIW